MHIGYKVYRCLLKRLSNGIPRLRQAVLTYSFELKLVTVSIETIK